MVVIMLVVSEVVVIVVEGGGGSESSKGYVNVLDGDVVGVDVAQNGGIAFCD